MKYVTARVLFLFAVACAAHADVLSDRATLDGILGSGAVTEDFESFQIDNGNAVVELGSNYILNSSTIYQGQGPGLVIDGVNFIGETGIQWNGKDWFGQNSRNVLSAYSDRKTSTIYQGQGPGLVIDGVNFIGETGIQWNGKDWFGQNSRNILSAYSGNPPATLYIDFLNPTNALGLDFSAFTGYPDVADINVYGSDKTSLLYSGSVSVPGSTPVFWGFFDSSGIGKVALDSRSYTWGAIIDNVEFGAATTTAPEPVSTTLFLLGGATLAVRRLRRKK